MCVIGVLIETKSSRRLIKRNFNVKPYEIMVLKLKRVLVYSINDLCSFQVRNTVGDFHILGCLVFQIKTLVNKF